jgi:hypothetical protein
LSDTKPFPIAPAELQTVLRPFIRKLLVEVLRTDADFDAFCMDYFHPIEQQFSAEMDRTRKINLLFQRVDPKKIFTFLQLHCPEDFSSGYDSVLRSMKPASSPMPLSTALAELLPTSAERPPNAAVRVPEPLFSDFAATAQSLLSSLPHAPLEIFEPVPDIFGAGNPHRVGPSVPLYLLRSGRHVAHSVTFFENSDPSYVPNITTALKPGHYIKVNNDTNTGVISILSMSNFLYGSGAVRDNAGVLTTESRFVDAKEQWRTRTTVWLRIVANDALHLEIEERATERVQRSLFGKRLPDCVLRWRMETVRDPSQDR